jgi:hypothetical protein
MAVDIGEGGQYGHPVGFEKLGGLIQRQRVNFGFDAGKPPTMNQNIGLLALVEHILDKQIHDRRQDYSTSADSGQPKAQVKSEFGGIW